MAQEVPSEFMFPTIVRLFTGVLFSGYVDRGKGRGKGGAGGGGGAGAGGGGGLWKGRKKLTPERSPPPPTPPPPPESNHFLTPLVNYNPWVILVPYRGIVSRVVHIPRGVSDVIAEGVVTSSQRG